MGGGQANKGQATQAANQQTAASNQDMALSRQNQAEQGQIFNSLFGNGKTGGSLTGMMDPNSINQKDFNPAYQTQWNQAQGQIGQDYANQRGSLARSWANSGMGANNTPSGFQADQQRKLASSEADTRGATFAGLKGEQYKDALSNFWNANNIATGQASSARTGATEGAGNSGSSSAALYGTAGQYHQGVGAGLAQSAIGAAGTAGAGMAMCPADGSKILMADSTRKMVEDLHKGDLIQGIDGKPDELLEDPAPTMQKVCEVFTREARVKVSWTHTFVRNSGGYVFAGKCLGELVDTDHGPRAVLEVRILDGEMLCRHLMLKRSHGYNVEGFWCLE
jgi:hypothetical protein